MTHPSASDSFATLALYKFIYLLTYNNKYYVNSHWDPFPGLKMVRCFHFVFDAGKYTGAVSVHERSDKTDDRTRNRRRTYHTREQVTVITLT